MSQPRARRRAWPSVEDQLGAARARPGSALEALIRDNQQFDLLDPSEARDQLPFPPWFRVYVRKGHPEVEFSGPPVGYPLILERVLEYMLDHPDNPTGTGPVPLLQGGAAPQARDM